MLDTDSYMTKCMLEAIEKGISTEHIKFECECKLGFRKRNSYDNTK